MLDFENRKRSKIGIPFMLDFEEEKNSPKLAHPLCWILKIEKQSKIGTPYMLDFENRKQSKIGTPSMLDFENRKTVQNWHTHYVGF